MEAKGERGSGQKEEERGKKRWLDGKLNSGRERERV